jgi:hypothetical protein
MDTCMTPLVQNAVERERGTWWCPRCERYADGSGGFPAGDALRVRLEDRQPTRRELAEALKTQGAAENAHANTGLSEGSARRTSPEAPNVALGGLPPEPASEPVLQLLA